MCEHIYSTISFPELLMQSDGSKTTVSVQNGIIKCYVRHSCGLHRSSMDRDVEVLGQQVDLIHGKDSDRIV